MKVVYKETMLMKIQSAKMKADLEGKTIERIFVSPEEMDELVYELDGNNKNNQPKRPRVVPFKGFNVLEVFNAE